MKDLKYIHEFEDLLQVANNDLVKEAKENGKMALGYTCYFIPKVLLNLGDCFSVRLRAPNTGSLDISSYYMTNFLCGYSKAILERAIEGGYNFLDGILSSETCSEMNRAIEHFELLKLVDENFLLAYLDAPLKVSAHGNKYYADQLRNKFLIPLAEKHGVDISEKALLKAVEENNRLCTVMNNISELRKEKNPKITGTEFHILNLIASSCPIELIIEKLEETYEELKRREVDSTIPYRARVVLVGSEIDDYNVTKLIEDSGALVVADRYCFGSLPGIEPIVLEEGKDILLSIVEHYFNTSECPRFMDQEKVSRRREYVNKLVQDFKADGVIYQALKFCEYWGYERPLASHVLNTEYNVPTVNIDRNYTIGAQGQIRTRVQAFVESLEIKRIQSKKKEV